MAKNCSWKGLILICLFLFFKIANSSPEPKVIRVAILDNFHFQPYITNNFEKNYITGIRLANHLIKNDGYSVVYKVFGYSREKPLAILSSVELVKKWNPDVILGPRNSNLFLLIQNSFKDILVLSPFATSDKIQDMPKNYYSLMYPDKYLAKVIDNYIYRNYPSKDIFSIIEADCKNCVDIGNDFLDIWETRRKGKKIIKKQYVQSNLDQIDINELMDGYQKESLILLPNTAYSSAILMAKITNYLDQPLIFVGGDDWGLWDNTEVGKLRANKPYYGLHFTSSSIDINDDPFITKFKNDFYNYYKKNPTENAALLGYTAIFAIVTALEKYNKYPSELNTKEEVLQSFLTALKETPNWFRPNKYAVYKINNFTSKYIASVSIE